MENKPRPPISEPTGKLTPLPVEPINLQEVATCHREVLLALLFSGFVEILLFASYFMESGGPDIIATGTVFVVLAMLLNFAATIWRCLTVFDLAKALQDSSSWLYLLLSITFLIGCFVIWKLDSRARKRLHAVGIYVGFWGAKVNKALS